MPIGQYALHIEAAGFKTFSQRGVELTANQNACVDAALEVGSLNQSVSVVAEAPQVDSRSSTVGTLIDSRRVVELPINGRNIISLVGLLPGASQVNAPQTFTGDRSGPTLSVSGSRANENLVLFDGAEFNAAFRNTGLNLPRREVPPGSRRRAGGHSPIIPQRRARPGLFGHQAADCAENIFRTGWFSQKMAPRQGAAKLGHSNGR